MKHRLSRANPPQAMQAQSAQPLASVRVLLVEDEFDVANLLLFILNEAGAEIMWVTQSADAIACLQEFCPDILLCNVRLPDRDGDWLIGEIRRAESGTTQHLPAIAITSYTREVAAEKMLQAGFERFLPKDFDTAQLISTILDLV
ncbi:response regulator [Leptolyngbya ohadii]|uniref:response regulator n=1 Tax=Leptolyngbya ohadii TaxID=1962290 RepID=UPI000B59AD47|nr:response regulator [Leptolyngbya ohadii]